MRMEFNFKTNLKEPQAVRKNFRQETKFYPPSVELTFSNDIGYVSVIASFESDLSVSDGIFSADYKGLGCETFDRNFKQTSEDWTECDDETMIDRFYSLMAGAEPVGFYVDPCDLSDYDDDFKMRVRDFDAEIRFQIHGKDIVWNCHADKLLPEEDVIRRAYEDKDFLFTQEYVRAYYFPSGMKGETRATYLKVDYRESDTDGWDYTFYDSDFRLIDGGVLDNDEPIDEAVPEIIAMYDEDLDLTKALQTDYNWLVGKTEE